MTGLHPSVTVNDSGSGNPEGRLLNENEGQRYDNYDSFLV